MPLFVDTSALCKLYVEEEGSAAMRTLARSFPRDWFISDLVALELEGVLGKMLRQKVISRAAYREASTRFQMHYRDRFNLVEITPDLTQLMVFLASNYAERSLSPLDVAHLVTADHLSRRLNEAGEPHDVVMVASDRRLATAAGDAGMGAFDPETDDPVRLHPPALDLDP
jgi:predicted nucleic acid-binding protein